MQVIAKIAELIEARNFCKEKDNKLWFQLHSERLEEIVKNLPSGSGIDNGTKLLLNECNPSKVVFSFSFHHMNEHGSYTTWTDHKVIVTPAFRDIDIKITGKNRNQIKDYLHSVYLEALTEEYTGTLSYL